MTHKSPLNNDFSSLLWWQIIRWENTICIAKFCTSIINTQFSVQPCTVRSTLKDNMILWWEEQHEWRRCSAAPKVTLAIWLKTKSLHAILLDEEDGGDTYDRVTRCIKRRRHIATAFCKRRKLSSWQKPSPHSFCSINLADKSRIRVGRLCPGGKWAQQRQLNHSTNRSLEGDSDMYIIITRIPHFIRGRPKERTNQLNAFAELTRPVHKTIHRSRCVPARPVECRVALRCRLAKWSHKIFDKYEAIWAS